jgi:hypothetical protein
MITVTLGLRQLPATTRLGIYARSSSRDAQSPAGLCADKYGGATTDVTGYTIHRLGIGVANYWRGRAMMK